MIDNRLAVAETDPVKKPPSIVCASSPTRRARSSTSRRLLSWAASSDEGAEPVALINGKSMTIGDMLNPEMIVRAINREEIEFIFRGVVFARRF